VEGSVLRAVLSWDMLDLAQPAKPVIAPVFRVTESVQINAQTVQQAISITLDTADMSARAVPILTARRPPA